MFGWFRRRAPAPEAPEPEAALFDASIDFDPAQMAASADEVREAVSAIRGAGWVSVEAHAGARLEVRLFPAGSSFEAVGTAWDGVRAAVERAIGELCDTMPAFRSSPPATGFAEPAAGFGESPAQLAALEQLAAIASLRATPNPPTPAPIPTPAVAPPLPPDIAEGDVFRLSRLLALVLPVDGREPAVAAVRRFGSFAAVLAAPEAELRRIPGLGTHCVAAIKLVHAAAIRHARAAITLRPVLDDRARLADYLAVALARERIEQFRILFLDADGMLQADEVQARGTVNHTPVYPREVVRRAIALKASALILVHNHPSGDPAPSRDDIEMTRQVQQAAAVLQIALRDHVIVGNGRWLSFRDEGLLD